MKKESFYFESKVDGQKIHALKYIPDGEVTAVLQISHGMVEFIERYEDFAAFLCENNIMVVGNDHRGHGDTAKTPEEYGYFVKDNPTETVLSDIHTLTILVKREYPDVPYFLMGHSMGSFFARRYLCHYGDKLSGAIIMGTGCQARALVKLGKALTKIIGLFRTDKHRSGLIEIMAFGTYNKKFKPARTRMDWLSKDEAAVDRFIAEKRCDFRFTLNAFYGMFNCIDSLYNKENLSNMPKELPTLFVSGSLDPVGGYEKGVRKAYGHFQKAGMKNIQLKFYKEDRHEPLHETDKEVVYSDILCWLKDNIK